MQRRAKKLLLARRFVTLAQGDRMKLTPTTLMARIAFYLALITLATSALSFGFPDWQRLGITAGGLLKLTDTFLLVSIAMILASSHDRRDS